MSTAVEILEFSRDLIKNGWTSGNFAENREGFEVDPMSTSACSFCAAGAMSRAIHVLKPSPENSQLAHEALQTSLSSDFYGVIHFNDSQQSEEPVIDLFDRAIESLKESV